MFFVALTPLPPEYADKYDLSKAGLLFLPRRTPRRRAFWAGSRAGVATSRFGARPTTITGLVVMSRHDVHLRDRRVDLWSSTRRASSRGWGALAPDRGAFVARQRDATRAPWADDRHGHGDGDRRRPLSPSSGGAASVVGEAVAFRAASTCSVITLALWALSMHGPPQTQPQPLSSLLGALRNRQIVLGICSSPSPALSSSGMPGVLAPLRLRRSRLLSAVAIGTLWPGTAALEATANPVVGRISDRVGLASADAGVGVRRGHGGGTPALAEPGRHAGGARRARGGPRSGASGLLRCRSSPMRPSGEGSSTPMPLR